MVKFIYFDVGGVLVKDFSRTNKWHELQKDIGVATDDHDAFDKFFGDYEGEICVGMDIEDLIPLMTKKFGLKISTNYSLLQDILNRIERNDSIVPVLNFIRKDVKFGLLTNMYPRMLNSLTSKTLLPEFTWDVVIDSSVEGVRKPQRKIFELAQKKAGVSSEQILFVENTKTHIEAAKKIGWNIFLYDSSDYAKASQDLMKEIVGLTTEISF
jgi:HAD superfamily hydrolase (TIGR01509 family)